jgi:hypothetical protein
MSVRSKEVELIAFVETNPDRRQEARRCNSAALNADYGDLLRMRDLDAVIVSVPAASNAEVAIVAMQLGNPLCFCRLRLSQHTNRCRVLPWWCHRKDRSLVCRIPAMSRVSTRDGIDLRRYSGDEH